MELFFNLVAVGGVILVAAASPGPDFFVVSKNSIAHSRSLGAVTAVGVALGCLVHIAYTLVGIGYIISQSLILFSAIKFAGAAYLVYLGVQLMTAPAVEEQMFQNAEGIQKSYRSAFREGFMTNVLNPKATVFFVSVFSQFMTPNVSFAVKALYGAEAVGIVCLWFVLLAYVLNVAPLKVRIVKVQNGIMKFMGAALLLFGVRLASSQQ